MNDTSDDLPALLATTQRLLPWHAPWGQFGEGSVILYPEGTPPNSLDLPGLPDSRLIGSCVRGTWSETSLETRISPSNVLQFFEARLPASGWQIQGTGTQTIPSEQGDESPISATFCRSPDGPSLTLSVVRIDPEETRVRLCLDRAPDGICARPPRAPKHRVIRDGTDDFVPPLTIPPGAARHSHGTSGHGNYRAHVSFVSSRPIAEITDHFAGILQGAGWLQDRAGGLGPVRWSTWRCGSETDDSVAGLLLAYVTEAGAYVVQVERDMPREMRARFVAEDRERARMNAESPVRAMSPVIVGESRAPAGVDAVRALILSLITPHNPTVSPGYERPELFAARLPPSTPSNLPFPPGTVPIGALQLRMLSYISLQCELPPLDILRFYGERLPQIGWSFFGQTHHPGGFVASDGFAPAGGLFCPNDGEPAIELSAHAPSNGPTELHLTLYTDLSVTPCRNPDHPARWVWRSRQPVLPPLPPPPEAHMSRGGGQSNQVVNEQRAYLYTTVSMQEIADWYAGCFARAGWRRNAHSNDAVVAWSTWDTHDDTGDRVHALFLAVWQPDLERYSLLARASQSPSETHRGTSALNSDVL